MWFEERFIFLPTVYPHGEWDTLELLKLPKEEHFFTSSDGTELHAWYIPHRSPSAMILYCHGNAGNLTHRSYSLYQLHHLAGVSTLIFDYRGYGKSEGKPNERGILRDGAAARELLSEIGGIAPEDIVLLGRSIGAAVATHLAMETPSQKQRLVLESAFTSFPELVRHLYPFLPARKLLHTRFPVLERIKRYPGSLLISHGDADHLVPLKQGEKLYEHAERATVREFFLVEGGDHNSPQPEEYYRTALPSFLKRTDVDS
jgi:hypothetical protein